MTVRLFISNLPYNVTGAELKNLFSTVGPVSYIYLPIDQATGKQRGFAFLDFNERAQAEEAVRRFNNQMFMGRPISVSEARAKEDRPRPAATGRSQGPSPRPPANQPASDSTMRKPAGGGSAFFSDDAPKRSRNKPKGKSRPERAPKAPMREVVKGQFFGGEEDDFSSDDASEENFASRVTDVEDEER
jgi:RNA recognition motif-containing protein